MTDGYTTQAAEAIEEWKRKGREVSEHWLDRIVSSGCDRNLIRLVRPTTEGWQDADSYAREVLARLVADAVRTDDTGVTDAEAVISLTIPGTHPRTWEGGVCSFTVGDAVLHVHRSSVGHICALGVGTSQPVIIFPGIDACQCADILRTVADVYATCADAASEMREEYGDLTATARRRAILRQQEEMSEGRDGGDR